MESFIGVNTALVGLSQKILKEGVWRETRGFKCLELPQPVMIEIQNPRLRYITLPERKWNKTLPWIESLWLASGANTLEMPGSYVKNLYKYSDDGKSMRAAYSPRLRFYTGTSDDYYIDPKDSPDETRKLLKHSKVGIVDQFKFIIDSFKRDPNTRQAGITIHDPVKDDYDKSGDLKQTLDTPCFRILQFQIVEGKLNMTVFARSNDLLWGFSAVNLFNFTLMQEYFSMMLGVPIGKYYHIANNLHVYENFYDQTASLANLSLEEVSHNERNSGKHINPESIDKKLTLEEFDSEINSLVFYEDLVRKNSENTLFQTPVHNTENAFFNDWGNTIGLYWAKKNKKDTQRFVFKNPILTKLYGENK